MENHLNIVLKCFYAESVSKERTRCPRKIAVYHNGRKPSNKQTFFWETLHNISLGCSGMSVVAVGCSGMYVDAVRCSGMSVDAVGFNGMMA